MLCKLKTESIKMLPSCESIIMSEKTFLSDEWKEDPFLLILMKFIKPVQLPIKTSNYLEDGQMIFYKPNFEMQLILDEYRNLGKGRTVEFCTQCGFRMFKFKPTPRCIESICLGCIKARAKRFKDMLGQLKHSPIMINPTSISTNTVF